LLIVVLQVDNGDEWRWIPDPVDECRARWAYQILTNRTPPAPHDVVPTTLLWRKDIPMKVSVHAC